MGFYEYSSDYRPSMPVCDVFIGVVGEAPAHGPFQAILDTGADYCIVPLPLIRQLNLKRLSRGRARSIWGTSRAVDIYAASLAIEKHQFQTVQILGDAEGSEIIIGRFVLNWLTITFDGLGQHVEIAE